MARYCGVNSLAGGLRNSINVLETTTAGKFDSAYVSNGILVGASSAEFFDTHDFFTTATGVVWFRFDYFGGLSSSTGVGPALYNGATGVFRLVSTSGATSQFQYWNGSAWTATGSTFSLTDSVLHTFVVQVDLTTGAFQAYQNNAPIASGSGWTGFGTQATKVRGQAMRGGGGTTMSQIMAADYDLRDSHLMAAALNGNSATNTAGTGVYTDVNETTLDDSTAIILAAAGKNGQTHAAITVPVGLGIAALIVAARGKVSGGVVTDGKLGVRSGGTNYSSTGRTYSGGYEPRAAIWEADPATALAWTQTSFNAAETYLEAV